MAQRIDAKGTVLKDDHARHPRNEKGTESRDPAAPDQAKDRRQNKGDQSADPVDVTMLPKDERILLQIGHVVERRERVELEHQPSDVGVKETFGDAIRVFVVVDMLMVGTVFAGPEKGRVFKSARAEDQREESYAPARLEGQVRKEPMVTDRNGKPASAEHQKEEHHLEPIDSEETKIGGYRGEGEKEGANEKRTGRPIYFFERDS